MDAISAGCVRSHALLRLNGKDLGKPVIRMAALVREQAGALGGNPGAVNGACPAAADGITQAIRKLRQGLLSPLAWGVREWSG